MPEFNQQCDVGFKERRSIFLRLISKMLSPGALLQCRELQ